jgi:SOS-response transcriptional repressor LexA
MLRVQGTSMIDAGIFDGDKIVVRRGQTAENGEIIVALVEDSATVKRFYKRDGKIILHPENDRFQKRQCTNLTTINLNSKLLQRQLSLHKSSIFSLLIDFF